LVALAILPIRQYRDFSRRQAETLALADSLDFSWEDALLLQLRREQDSELARLQVARALIGDILDLEGPPAEGARLELARDLGLEAVSKRPASWEGPLLLGAAVYLQRSLDRDPRLYREPAQWQDPLLRSLALAPGQREPTLFLAAAYLEVWPALSPAKKDLGRQLVQQAMKDPRSFDRLLAPWIERAKTREELFAAIPPRSTAWRSLETYYDGEGNWRAYLEAHERTREARQEEAQRALEEARERLIGGDLKGARHLFLTAALAANPGPESESLVREALSKAPAGGFNPHYASGLRHHLDRALELYLRRQVPFEAPVVARLAAGAGELPPAVEALALLAADDLPGAERIERKAGAAPWDPEWSPFRIAKARSLLLRSDVPGAEASLAMVDDRWQQDALYWRVRLAAAERRKDPEVQERYRQRLEKLARASLEAADWRGQGQIFRVEWYSDRQQDKAVIEVLNAPARGGAVALRLDGAQILTLAIRPQTRRLEVPLSAAANELHFLEVESLAGGVLIPGRVQFFPLP
jgi:hypothetical protein